MNLTILPPPEIVATPARRVLPAAPILIRVPVLATAVVAPAMPRRRRRLRREVRLAASALLIAIPSALLAPTLADRLSRSPSIASAGLGDELAAHDEAAVDPSRRRAAITLSLEPVAIAAAPGREAGVGPIFLSGQLLPVDPSEEPSRHGRH